MKYEFKIVYKEHICGETKCHYRTICPPARFDSVKESYLDALEECKDIYSRDWYYCWLQINLLDDNGEFIEVIQ